MTWLTNILGIKRMITIALLTFGSLIPNFPLAQKGFAKVGGKTGERVVRYGSTTAKSLGKYLKIRTRVDGSNDSLRLTEQGAT